MCFCINATSFISSDTPTLPSDLAGLSISSTGVLYIPNVYAEMRARADRPATCTVWNSEGQSMPELQSRYSYFHSW